MDEARTFVAYGIELARIRRTSSHPAPTGFEELLEDDGRRLASDVMQAADLTAELTELPLF